MTACAKQSKNMNSDVMTLLHDIDSRLEQLLPISTERDSVGAAMRAGALAPGKRIRPILLMLAASDLGYQASRHTLLDLACAIEMVHAASLILDDMPCMDNALQRRGRPTVHCQFGEHVAILSAVALLSKAFGVVAAVDGLSSTARAQAVAVLSEAVGNQGLVQGQFKDLTEGGEIRSAEAILMANQFKTSVLFGASMQIAALATGVSQETGHRLHCFALDLGQAFQLLDDLSDGHQGTGKDINKDAGKSTLLNLLGEKAVEKQLREHLNQADQHLAAACDHGMSTRRFVHSWFDQKLAAFS